MANNCYYVMKVVGRGVDINTFYKRLKGKDGDNYIGRVFSAEIYESENEIEKTLNTTDVTYVCFSGDCAWSVSSSMISGYEYSNLVDVTEELGLVVEIYSEEYGCCFQEHYLIGNGAILVGDCVDAYLYNGEDYEGNEKELEDKLKYAEKKGLPIKEEDGWITVGGFEDWSYII